MKSLCISISTYLLLISAALAFEVETTSAPVELSSATLSGIHTGMTTERVYEKLEEFYSSPPEVSRTLNGKVDSMTLSTEDHFVMVNFEYDPPTTDKKASYIEYTNRSLGEDTENTMLTKVLEKYGAPSAMADSPQIVYLWCAGTKVTIKKSTPATKYNRVRTTAKCSQDGSIISYRPKKAQVRFSDPTFRARVKAYMKKLREEKEAEKKAKAVLKF